MEGARGRELASKIDLTLLRADASSREVEELCRRGAELGFAAVCVNPYWAELASRLLKGSGVKVCCTVGFPIGATLGEVKAFEAAKAVERGASEIDVAVNLGALKSGSCEVVEEELRLVVEAVKSRGGEAVKAIIEVPLLTLSEVEAACQAALRAGVDYVKTGTGVLTRGVTVEDVKLLRRFVEGRAKIKASGGVRNYRQALDLLKAGASRIGTSAGYEIVLESLRQSY